MSGGHRSDAGFALLAALWLVVLVIGVTSVLLVPLRTARLQARNAITAGEARLEATSGLVHAIALLERSHAAHETGARGASGAAVRLHAAQGELRELGRVTGPGGGTYELSLADESARYPINRASEAEIQRFLIGLGFDHLEAVEVAAAIADWLDPDELHRLHGAEWDDHYADIPGARRPSNRPFVTVGELRFVRGIRPALHSRLTDLVTIETDARVNLNSAPHAVIAGLPGFDGRSARQVTAARRSGRILATLEDVADILDAPARERLQARYADLRTRITFTPATYGIVSIGTPAAQGHPVRLEARVAIHGGRASVIRITERRGQ